MAETKGRKKKSQSQDDTQTLNFDEMTSGEWLRQVRMQRGLGLEEISASINVRVAQLRAIEEGNIEALPGMTYAVGFVKSYAGVLKLDAAAVAEKFKAEHGAMKPVMHELQTPQPIVESRMPDPMIMGVAAFCAILILLLWTIFSSGEDEEIAELATDNIMIAAPIEPAQPFVPQAPAAQATQEAPAMASAEPSAPQVFTPEPLSPQMAAEKRTAVLNFAAVAVPRETPPTPEAVAAPAPENEVINIRRPGGRVTLKATQASWIQVEDAKGNVLFKKILKPGETYSVPNQKDLRLLTSNAGGFDVIVDGERVKPLGKSGEIKRGVSLDPDYLKKIRVNSSLNN